MFGGLLIGHLLRDQTFNPQFAAVIVSAVAVLTLVG